MKKTLSLFLTLAMLCAVFGLTACGGSPSASTATPAPNTPSATDPSPAGDTPEQSGPVYDELHLLSAVSDTENTYKWEVRQWYADTLYERSGGKIVLEIYYGSSFCSSAETPEYVSNGSLHISFSEDSYLWEKAPLISPGSGPEPSLFVDVLLAQLEDPVLGPMIYEQAAQNNWYPLGWAMTGADILLSKTEVTGFDDIAANSLRVGSPAGLDTWQKLGAGTANIPPPDMYEALSRGLTDAVAFSASGVYLDHLYETANNVLELGKYMGGDCVMMNLDLWNSLNADTQALFKEVTRDYGIWTATDDAEVAALLKEEILSRGGTWHTLSAEDSYQFNLLSQSSHFELMKTFAANLGCEDELATQVEFRRQQLGIDYEF